MARTLFERPDFLSGTRVVSGDAVPLIKTAPPLSVQVCKSSTGAPAIFYLSSLSLLGRRGPKLRRLCQQLIVKRLSSKSYM